MTLNPGSKVLGSAESHDVPSLLQCLGEREIRLHVAACSKSRNRYPHIETAPVAIDSTPESYFRQNVAVTSSSKGKTSSLPSNIASVQTAFPASLTSAKFAATLPRPGPVLFMQVAIAENAVT